MEGGLLGVGDLLVVVVLVEVEVERVVGSGEVVGDSVVVVRELVVVCELVVDCVDFVVSLEVDGVVGSGGFGVVFITGGFEVVRVDGEVVVVVIGIGGAVVSPINGGLDDELEVDFVVEVDIDVIVGGLVVQPNVMPTVLEKLVVEKLVVVELVPEKVLVGSDGVGVDPLIRGGRVLVKGVRVLEKGVVDELIGVGALGVALRGPPVA